MLDVIQAKIAAAEDEAPLREHLAVTLAGPEGPPGEAIVDEAVGHCRNYVAAVPELIGQALGAAQLSGGLEHIAPLMEQVAMYFLNDQDLIPDHAGLLGVLDDALFANRMLEVLSATYASRTGMPLITGDLGPANRASAAFLGPQVAGAISAAVDQAVGRRVLEVEMEAAAAAGYSPGGGGGTFEDQAGDFFARYGSEFGGSGDIDIYHNPVW